MGIASNIAERKTKFEYQNGNLLKGVCVMFRKTVKLMLMVAVAAAFIMGTADAAEKTMCKTCEGMIFTTDSIKCPACKTGWTGSGMHKHCGKCAVKLQKCAACGVNIGAPAPVKPKPAVKKARPKVDVVFVLDTTGSMGGLIEGAKRKIWSIANKIISAKPTPDIRIGLVAYRDRGREEYITKVFDLTTDIDKVYANLRALKANGGGDGPESVNQALHEAVTKMKWTKGGKALKMIFLVGDAPPHMDYKNDVQYMVSCKTAVTNWITINTVRCGVDFKTETTWKDIAKRADGSYASIAQGGGMVAIKTPMDKDIAELNRKMGRTRVVFGRRKVVKALEEKMEKADKLVEGKDREDDAAERAVFKAKKSSPSAPMVRDSKGKVVSGDLVDAVGGVGGGKKLNLAKVKKEELPEVMKKMRKGLPTHHQPIGALQGAFERRRTAR